MIDVKKIQRPVTKLCPFETVNTCPNVSSVIPGIDFLGSQSTSKEGSSFPVTSVHDLSVPVTSARESSVPVTSVLNSFVPETSGRNSSVPITSVRDTSGSESCHKNPPKKASTTTRKKYPSRSRFKQKAS